jgi:hypothetical protein
MMGYRLALYPTGQLVGQQVDFCWPTGLLVLRSEQPLPESQMARHPL